MSMRLAARFLLCLILPMLLTAAAGCSALLPAVGQQAPSDSDATAPVPTATPDMAGYQNLPERACLVAEVASLRTDQADNRTLAWSPEGDRLAYISPAVAHGWFSGDLALLSGDGLSQRQVLAEDAAGGLTWAPEGDQLVFTTLRQQDEVMTVMVMGVPAGTPRDLFPGTAARTDEYSSPKTVAGWPTRARLYVRSGCGDGCIKMYELNPASGASREVDADTQVGPRPPVFAEDEFPVMYQPAWTEDARKLAFFDEDGGLWALSVDEHLVTSIQYTGYTPVNIFAPADQELAWSAHGQLAARLDDKLLIYNFPCSGN